VAGSQQKEQRPGEGVWVGRIYGKEITLYDDMPPLRDMEGEWERFALYAGESVGVVHDLRGAGDIVAEVLRDAITAIRRLHDSSANPVELVKDDGVP